MIREIVGGDVLILHGWPLFTLKPHSGVLFHVVFVLLVRKLFRNWENTNCGQVFLPLRQVSDKNYGMFLPKAMAATSAVRIIPVRYIHSGILRSFGEEAHRP